MNIATIILATGEHVSLDIWQKIYGLKVGSAQIGKHFEIGERSIPNGVIVSAILIQVLDQARIIKGKPVSLNSLSRTQTRQEELIAEGKRAAATSPHVVYMGADADTASVEETKLFAKQLKEAAKMLGFKVRIGFKKYIQDGDTFVHVDVCPEYYAKGKPYHHKQHPPQWETEQTW